mgnify:CR=1 FL=1
MSMSDPLADLLTRIRNGQMAGKETISAPASKLRINMLDVLKREGYIRNYERYNVRTGIDEVRIELKYYDGEPVIKEISRISRPGQRVYARIKDLPRAYNGLGISILATPRGSMSGAAARARA